jgi:hypothetical protein
MSRISSGTTPLAIGDSVGLGVGLVDGSGVRLAVGAAVRSVDGPVGAIVGVVGWHAATLSAATTVNATNLWATCLPRMSSG